MGISTFRVKIVPHFKRMPIDADDERWEIWDRKRDGIDPYQWIIHTRKREEDKRQCYLRAAPSENEIVEVAVKAIDAVKERLTEIQARRQEAENGRRSDLEDN